MRFRFKNPNKSGYPGKLPSSLELKQLKKGMFVYINHKGERFWVQVLNTKNNNIYGLVDYKLIQQKHGFKQNDIIKFKTYHVYSIATKYIIQKKMKNIKKYVK